MAAIGGIPDLRRIILRARGDALSIGRPRYLQTTSSTIMTPARSAQSYRHCPRRCTCHWETIPLNLLDQSAHDRYKQGGHRQHPRFARSYPKNPRQCVCYPMTMLLTIQHQHVPCRCRHYSHRPHSTPARSCQ